MVQRRADCLVDAGASLFASSGTLYKSTASIQPPLILSGCSK